MRYKRRTLLRGILAFLAVLGTPIPRIVFAHGSKSKAFDAKRTPQVLDILYGDRNFIDSDRITFNIPDIAENGAVVPVNIKTDLLKVSTINILAERNPRPLVASFTLPEGTLPEVSVRIRLAETTRVIAIVEADGKRYGTTKQVQVTVGGCGG